MFALARHRLLPAPFAKLSGPNRTPGAAVLCVVAICVAAGVVTLAILGNGLDSFVWWSNAMVFFAALTFTGVNLANLLYFWRIAPGAFRPWANLVAPILGVGLSLYLLYAAFFSALWSAPFRTGRSVVLVCVGLLALEAVVAIALRASRRGLTASSPPVGVGES